MVSYKDIYINRSEIAPLYVDKFQRVSPYLSSNTDVYKPVLAEELHKRGFRAVYKGDKKYAVCFSHDIDFLYELKNSNSYFISFLQDLKRGHVRNAVHNGMSVIKPQPKSEWDIRRLIDIEEKNSIRSSYYFLALDKGEEDQNYMLQEVQKYFSILEDMGCEIGLHGGHSAFNNADKLKKEKEILEQHYGKKVVGYRNHYLRFINPLTWEILINLGFKYDTTYGLAETPGYRNGMCYPFRPFHPGQNTFMDILEVPLLVMDVSFFKYLNLDVVNAYALYKIIHNQVKALNGVLTIVWHNNCLDGEHGQLYTKIISDVCKDEECWVTTTSDITDWWKEYNLGRMEEVLLDVFKEQRG